ncbi:FadR/GntR family transcriptional regulator [Gelria sp. Kuro-4]|uniref:FadR/GntR family transcriptional regulator n=1 Tax=Gelria sp. Kuro-4 TaxID=2796927 RepID=UPI001BF00EA8|nr:FadR/GntR family transcriptional regulator [Gelria sp. Kuro-4]BCV24820.1 GntR family transcriptional regulator [Gelria sp. Kuro-4]
MDVIKRITVRDSLIGYFQNQLLRGKLSPGDKLPTEKELSESLRVGRASIREALSALTFMGILKKTPEGTFVNDKPGKLPALTVLSASLIYGSSDYQLYEARKIIEVGIAGLAAERATREKVARLEQSIETLRTLIGQGKEFFDEDVRFHLGIVEMTGNKILYSLMETMSELIAAQMSEKIAIIAKEKGLSYAMAIEYHHTEAIKEHSRILDDLKRGDCEAAQRSMFFHLHHWQKYCRPVGHQCTK